MEFFKLKEGAAQFFKKDLHTCIKTLEFWQSQGIHENLLEKVEGICVFYGLSKDKNYTQLCGWSSNSGHPYMELPFTLRVLDINHSQYEKVNIPFLMSKIQHIVNSYIETEIRE